MWERLLVAYDWIKAAHLIFVIFWMAGLFIFPRYLIHHQESLGTPEAARWVEREAKLRRVILTPAMILVIVLGVALIGLTIALTGIYVHQANRIFDPLIKGMVADQER